MNNPLPLSTRNAQRPTKCYLAHVRSVLGRMRNRHPPVGDQQAGLLESDDDVARCNACDGPSAHDRYAAELENALVAWPPQVSLVRYDDAREIARARLVFAASLASPLLIIAAFLGIPGLVADRALLSLLHFSEFALATPLMLVLGFSHPLRLSGRETGMPLRIAIGVAVTTAYVWALFVWSFSDSTTAAPIGFALAGLLAFSTRVREWVFASRHR